jgi:hypothetical protein
MRAGSGARPVEDAEAVLNWEAAADSTPRASRIEIKIDQIIQKSGDISQKRLDFSFFLFVRAVFDG